MLCMCTVTASIERIERCVGTGLFTHDINAAFTGTLDTNHRRKIKLGSLASIQKKGQSTDLDFERNLRLKGKG